MMEETSLSGGRLQYCFLCLAEIPSKNSSKEVDHSSSSALTQNTKLLIQYLLRCPAPHYFGDRWRDKIFQNVLKFEEDKHGGTQFVGRSLWAIRFCDNCVRQAEEVGKLEKELEEIRGRILDKVKVLEDKIAGASELENVVKNLKGEEVEVGRKFLEVFKSLRAFVVDRKGHQRFEENVPVKEESDFNSQPEDDFDHFDNDFLDSFNNADLEPDTGTKCHVDPKGSGRILRKRKKSSSSRKPVKKLKRANVKKKSDKPKGIAAKEIKTNNDERKSERIKTFFSCSKCPRRFQTKTKLDLHYRDEHDDDDNSVDKEENVEEEWSLPVGHITPGSDEDDDAGPKSKEGAPPKKTTHWWCPFCPEMFNRKFKLRQHRREAHPEAGEEDERLSCDNCGQHFGNKGCLVNHRKSGTCLRTEEIGVHLCTVCNKEFATVRLLNNHMRYHSTKEYFCDKCDYATWSPAHFKRHSMKHVDPMERPPVEKNVLCPHCDMRFAAKAILRKHLRVHTKETPFQCDICGHPFRYAHGLKRHKQVIHEERQDGKEFSCTSCEFRTTNLEYLKQHEVRHQPDATVFQCQFCGKGFQLKGNMRIHMRSCKFIVDPEERPKFERFACDLCEKTLTSRSGLEKHRSSQHGVGVKFTETLTCDRCSYTTLFPWNLKSHQRLHEKGYEGRSDKERRWHCDTCGMDYIQKSSLEQHLRKNVCIRRLKKRGINLDDFNQLTDP